MAYEQVFQWNNWKERLLNILLCLFPTSQCIFFFIQNALSTFIHNLTWNHAFTSLYSPLTQSLLFALIYITIIMCIIYLIEERTSISFYMLIFSLIWYFYFLLLKHHLRDFSWHSSFEIEIISYKSRIN